MRAALALGFVCLVAGCRFDTSGLQPDDRGPGGDRPRDQPADSPSPELAGDATRSETSFVDRATDAPADRSAKDTPADQPRTTDQPVDRKLGDRPVDKKLADKPVDKKLADKPPPPPCSTTYGSAGIPGYKDCGQTASTCRFYFSSSPTMSCDTACSKGGGTCVAAEYDDAQNGCTVTGPATCGELHGDAVCTCSR